MPRYKVRKHGNRITLTSEGINITYRGKVPVELGEVDLKEEDLDKIKIKVKGKGFEVTKNK